MLHALSTSIPSPRQFTYPFCYDVDPLAEAASLELQRYIADADLMSTEKGCGKMFGVLVVEYEDEEGALQRGFLAAYSGLLGGRNDWPYFVPPVFDAQQPDGHFKRTEREISAINREIAAIEHDAEYLQSVAQHEQTKKRLQAEVDAFKAEVDAAKARRDARRKSGEPLSEEEQAEMIRESQFMKAELRRRRKAMEQAESTLNTQHSTFLKSLQRKRKQMSDELQRWLFSAYRMLNAKGEERDLIDIFREYTHAMPPAGAGDCCAPKLLQYAYLHHLRPVCMAEFWWGESPTSEIRHHLHYYPACRSKCLPILTHMLKGLDVAPNPLAQKRHTVEPRVLYADEYIMVVDKPAGMLSVPGKAESVRSEFSDSANISVEEYFANLQLPTNSQLPTEQFTIGEADNSKLKIQNSKFELSSPEARGDVFKLAIGCLTVEALVGSAVFQSTEMTDVRANLDVVEPFLVHISRHLCATSVPSHFIIRIMLVNVFGNLAHTIVLRIAAHKTDACYVATITLHEPVDGVHGERFTNVIPQILAVATGTTTRTIGDVDGKGHLVWNLLKDDVGIYIFKHYFLILPLF